MTPVSAQFAEGKPVKQVEVHKYAIAEKKRDRRLVRSPGCSNSFCPETKLFYTVIIIAPPCIGQARREKFPYIFARQRRHSAFGISSLEIPRLLPRRHSRRTKDAGRRKEGSFGSCRGTSQTPDSRQTFQALAPVF